MAKAQAASKPAAPKPAAPEIGVVEPPKMSRGGKSGSQIPHDVLDAWLKNLNDADGKYVGTPETFDTKGKTQSKAQRLKAALVEYGELPEGVEIATRVWQGENGDGTPDGVFHFALRLRTVEKNAAK